jgi:hypothetical protein
MFTGSGSEGNHSVKETPPLSRKHDSIKTTATKGSLCSTRGLAVKAPAETVVTIGAMEKKLEGQASGKEPPLQGLSGLVLSRKEGVVKETQKEASRKVPTQKGMEVPVSKKSAVMSEAERNIAKKAPIVKGFEGSSTKIGTVHKDWNRGGRWGEERSC